MEAASRRSVLGPALLGARMLHPDHHCESSSAGFYYANPSAEPSCRSSKAPQNSGGKGGARTHLLRTGIFLMSWPAPFKISQQACACCCLCMSVLLCLSASARVVLFLCLCVSARVCMMRVVHMCIFVRKIGRRLNKKSPLFPGNQ